jgi:hypothetical protein
MIRIGFLLFCITIHATAQTKTVSVFDSAGSTSTATINGTNFYFHDSNGNTTNGTISDGNVFFTTDIGEVTVGTVRNGNVFLSDSHGTTTGTIRNGNILLSGSDGSVTTGSYHGPNVNLTTTTIIPTTTSPPDTAAQQAHQEEINRENYQAGYAVGQSVGNLIVGAMAGHQITSYCKANPEGTFHGNDGISTPCQNAPLDNWEQSQTDDYCRDHPGSWIEIGRHRIDCVHAPNNPNLKWATWEMNAWRENYKDRAKIKATATPDQMRVNWAYWQKVYCGMTPGAKFKDINGKKQVCP